MLNPSRNGATTKMKAAEKIRKELEDLKLEKVLMQFPIKHVGSGLFEIAPGFHCTIAARGAAYMNTRIRNRKKYFNKETLDRFSWKSFTDAVKNAKAAQRFGTAEHSWNAVAKHMNDCVATMQVAGIDKPIYAIIVDGELRGIPTKNFDFFDNENILEQIEENGLDDAVASWYIDEEKFEVCFRVKSAADRGVLVNVCLVNGHAGFDALRLIATIKNNKYNYVIPTTYIDDDVTKEFTTRNRHLGWIEQVFNSIIELLDRVGELHFIEHLKAMPAQDMVFEIMRSLTHETKQERRVMEILSWVNGQVGRSLLTGYDVFVNVSGYSSTRGYGAAVGKILDPTLDRIFEGLKGNANNSNE